MKHSNNNGFSMIEMMIVASIFTILALVAYSNLGRYSENTDRAEALAMLSQYYTLAKVASSEFLCNPGNFVTLGFNPLGQIKSRILAKSPDTPCTLPVGYPDKGECISTAYDKDKQSPDDKCVHETPLPYYSPSWQEVVPMNIIDENNDGNISDEQNQVDTNNDGIVDDDKCPRINGELVTPINEGIDLGFRALACLRNATNDKSRVVCICHNGITGGNEIACSKNDCIACSKNDCKEP